VWIDRRHAGRDGWLWYAMSLAILIFGEDDRYAALLSAASRPE
jgi:hypothetical protein